METWIILIIAAVFFISWKINQKKKETIAECLKRQAIKRNGLVKPSFLAYPRLSFRHLDTDILVSAMSDGILGSRSRSSQTYVSFYLPGSSDNWFDIRNKPMRKVFDRVFGMEDIQIENPEFDVRFTVHASDAMFIQTLLTRELQERILQFSHGKEPYVQYTMKTLFKDGRLVFGKKQPCLSVSVRKTVTEEEEYDRLIEIALMFHDRLRSAP